MTGFVPDVDFGNGRFASSDWPANKRERDVIFDPFWKVRNIICFDPGILSSYANKKTKKMKADMKITVSTI